MQAQTITRKDLEQALITKCWKEPEFRKEVAAEPKGMLEKQPGTVKIFHSRTEARHDTHDDSRAALAIATVASAGVAVGAGVTEGTRGW